LVFSVDHGHFFPGDPPPFWSAADLDTAATAVPDPTIMAGCGLSRDDLQATGERLAATATDDALAAIVAGIPDGWDFPREERIAMVRFLTRRRDEILSHLG